MHRDGAARSVLTAWRAAIARYGLNVADVREAVETGIGGMTATQVLEGRRRFDVVVRLDNAYRTNPEAIGQTLIRTPAGGTVMLSQVATLRAKETPEVVNHEGGQRYVVVQSNVRGRDLGGFVADVQRAVAAQVKLPPGYYLTYGGQFENQQRATRRLALIVPVVLLLIVGLLYASFASPGVARDAQRTVRVGRRHRGALAAWAQPQPERVGWHDCAGGHRRAQRRGVARVHRATARAVSHSPMRCARAPPYGSVPCS